MGFIFPYKAKVLKREFIRSNVFKISIERPYHYNCKIGQVLDLSIDCTKHALDVETYTIISNDTKTYFEVIIKLNPQLDRLSLGLSSLQMGENLLFSSPWDALKYGGPGIFFVEEVYSFQIVHLFQKILFNMSMRVNHKLIIFNDNNENMFFENEIKEIVGVSNRHINYQYSYESLEKKQLQKILGIMNQKVHIYGSYSFEKKIKELLFDIGINKNQLEQIRML